MFHMTITYGAPADAEVFMTHYRNVHMPLVAAVPGLVRATYGQCADPAGKTPAHFLVATLEFTDRTAYEAAMRTPQMAATGEDLKNFADGGVSMVVHEAVEVLPR